MKHMLGEFVQEVIAYLVGLLAPRATVSNGVWAYLKNMLEILAEN